MKRTTLAVKAVTQLGLKQSALFLLYRLGLASGYYRLPVMGENESNRLKDDAYQTRKIFDLPTRETFLTSLSQDDLVQLRKDADEILGAKVRLFGGEPVDLSLKPAEPLSHWTAYETGKAPINGDVKLIWESARFGWATTLARAFFILKDDKYRQAFWGLAGIFFKANPPYSGPNWMSAQEAALRLISLAFVGQVFATAEVTETKRLGALGKVIAVHANRIPPTLIYARAQNNNHLLSEAVGLITAGYLLPRHPQARRWLDMGWYWFNRGLEEQISDEGVYIQHSANYQRLMLQLALWVNLISKYHRMSAKENAGKAGITDANLKRLKSSAEWLLTMMDKESGQCPNLGPNDGAYIQPLSVCPYNNFRPVLQAGLLIFGGKQPFGKGSWDEMSLWYGARPKAFEDEEVVEKERGDRTPHVMDNPVSQSWAYLRIASFKSRPGHADQLHVDLWRQGINIAKDAGTFSYNNPSPWDNALAGAGIHNTITVNDADQMTHAGKFLWLDWAQARLVKAGLVEEGGFSKISAEHNGYKDLGILHRRSISPQSDGSWIIEDQLLPSKLNQKLDRNYSFRLHWLLCDSPFEWEPGVLTLFSKKGIITIQIICEKPISQYQLVRSGELQAGDGKISPTWGWASTVYGMKEPALSLSAIVMTKPPMLISTQFRFHNY